MNAPRARRRALAWIALGGAGLAAAALAAFLLRGGGAEAELPAGHALEVAQLEPLRAVPDFSLERLGGRLGAADLRGRWHFVFFGYTNCPDACPQTLGILSHVRAALRARGTEPPRIVFLSLDAQRDTPQVLHDYLAEFDAEAIGATGSAQALRGLLDFFGASFERKPGGDGSTYTLDHTSTFFLLTPDGRWLATFSPADDPDAVLEDTATLLRARYPG